MEKLFNILLNRRPTNIEINKLYNKNHIYINNYILGLEEYKNFLESNSLNVRNILKKEFGSDKNNKFFAKMIELLRNNNYNYDLIKYKIKQKKNEINNRIYSFLNKILNKSMNNLNLSEMYKIFFENNFDYKQFEFILVNSKFFNKLVDDEMDKFYKCNG